MAVATSENTSFGDHEWNKIWSYTDNDQIFCFFYALIAFIYNNLASACSSTLMSENNLVLHLENEPK